jgi:hypothetical protein
VPLRLEALQVAADPAEHIADGASPVWKSQPSDGVLSKYSVDGLR